MRLLLLLVPFAFCGPVVPQYWESVGGGVFSGDIYDLLYDSAKSRLYAVGSMGEMYLDTLSVNGVAYWEDGTWHAIGDAVDNPPGIGVCDPVTSIVIYDGDPVIGGFFNGVDSVPYTDGLATWSNDEWTTLGTDSPSKIAYVNFSLIDDDLHMMGTIDSVDGQATYNWAIWDGVHWTRADTSETFEFGVSKVITYQGEYVVGGNFGTTAGHSDLVHGVPGNWEEFGLGIIGDAWVNDMVVYDGLLWVAGEFFEMAGNAATALMVWDGVNWLNPFPDLHGWAASRDVHVANGKLYFILPMDINGMPGYYTLGVYDGNTVCVFGGSDKFFGKITCSADTLYGATCRYLTPTCGPPGLLVNDIAKWPLDAPPDTCFTVHVSMPEQPSDPTYFHYDLANDAIIMHEHGDVAQLRLFDPLGRLVMERRISGQSPVSVSALAPGSYIAVLTDRQGIKIFAKSFVRR